MTAPTIKVKLVRRPTLKLKVLPRFPSSVTVTSPITLARSGGNYQFGFDSSNAFSLTTTGSSGAATYTSGVLNIPEYISGGTPGGSTTQVQYNNAGAFAGITGATTNGTALTLVAPVLGTPASVTLTNATGLPISTGLTGAGTGVLTALGVNVGTAGAPVINGGALGTPSSGTLTNCTGLPVAGGGTGAASFTTNGLLIGNGSAAIQVTNTSANGVLVTNGSSQPSISSTLPTGLALQTPASGTLTNCTAFTLTTTGSSGAATYSAGTLNIPQYSGSGGVTTFNSRSGAVVPAQGDYPTSLINGTTTNDNATAGNIGEYLDTSSGNNNANTTVTMTIASPCVVTWTAHKFTPGTTTAIYFKTTGALPTGITANTTYYLKPIDANTFNIATSAANALAGTFINTSGSQSGTHTGDIRVFMTTATYQDLAAISLTAGDWDVSGQCLIATAATTTVTFIGAGISLASNSADLTFGRRLTIEFSNNTQVPSNAEFTTFNVGPSRISVASTTTVFVHGYNNFGTSTLQSAGWLRARRIR